MAWSSGTFSRAEGSSGCATDKAGGTGILATKFDTRLNEIATGINTCITKDGQNAATADLPMGGFKHSNVGDASARSHYAKVSQIQDGSYVHCGATSGTSTALTLSASPAISAYADGQRFTFRSTITNTGSTTLNINGVAVASLVDGSGRSLQGGEIVNGGNYTVIYNNVIPAFVLVDQSINGVIERQIPNTRVNNTTTETTVFSTTIRANYLTTKRGLRFTAFGNSNSTAPIDFTWRLKIGGTTFMTHAITVSASNDAWVMEALIMGYNSSAQLGGSRISLGGREFGTNVTNAPVIDSTANQTLAFTVQMSAANVSNLIDVYAAIIETL